MSLERIKKLTLRSLMSDEKLLYKLVLKGGNALQIVHQLINRSSLDIDFSMKGDFDEEELKDIKVRLEKIFDFYTKLFYLRRSYIFKI